MIAKLLAIGTALTLVADSPSQLGSSFFPQAIMFSNAQYPGEPLVTIKFDGTIEYGPHYTPDATAKVFWEHLGKNAPCRKDN